MKIITTAAAAILACISVSAQAAQASYPVKDDPFTRTLRSPTPEDLAAKGFPMGVYEGSPKVLADPQWYEDNFYNTLAAKKIWHDGTGPDTHERNGPITWDIAPIAQEPPPPCDQPQPTRYDAEGCRIAGALFKDVEAEDPAKAQRLREAVRRGRDVWFKGTFGNQDLNDIHLARTIGDENMHYAEWMHTKHRPYRYTKWGLINDPDCKQGDASTYWLDDCADPKSTGVVGYRKYFRDPTLDDEGNVVYDPRTAPYEEGEMESQKRFMIGHACVQCHVAFDPTHPPADPNEPEWENLMGLIGNQYVNQPHAAFLSAVPRDHFAVQAVGSARAGTVDTSLNPNDFQHNPGTQNNITDFINKRIFQHEMKHPITGEISTAPTQHVLKGGEDSVGDRLALLRVYINIGMCTEECWVPNFPVPGDFFGDGSTQKPMSIQQCSIDCEAWNYADAKMDDLAAYLLTGGPTYLLNATDVDGTPGSTFIDLEQVPEGRKVYARNCAQCHSTKVPPQAIVGDPDALERFYEGHVFGAEAFWKHEFTAEQLASERFRTQHLVETDDGQWRPRQFAENGMFGQDWLGNDEPTPYNVVGVNSCRARHDNHSTGHIWEEFASETYRQRPSPGSEPKKVNRMVPLLGGKAVGTKTIGGPAEPGETFADDGAGYYRNISLINVWAIAPFLHNNSVGELTYLEDGGIDYTVAGRIAQYEIAMQRLLMSDDPNDEPHRPQKITGTTMDIKVAPREDGQGLIKLPVAEGTPVAYFASSDPHKPLFQKCDDLVENKGHQFGVDLSAEDKAALTEFLKLM
ncbi:hypothetical protein [Abyssibacter profundi]|uniref:Cytochrome c domain-containing protein n=1 Tax=Abyssibacter profundi TaxID=2182787 RepID=A0A363UKP8_9GAMM|nr:hypothetical protein [Abyssibacter profundi]PWN56000.1 hypothetical protein DEH80_09275 [Abyssibacter profundi]